MKLIHKISLSLILLAAGFIPESASAQSFNWGGTNTFGGSQSTYFDSAGTALTTGAGSAYTFDFGFFNTGFNPGSNDISLWSSNWNSLATDKLDDSLPWTFGGTALVNGTASNGKSGYLWIYDSGGFLGSNGGQAFLGTGSTWTLPTFGSIDPAPTFDFANMTSVLYGQADTTFFSGAAGGILAGGGTITTPMGDNAFEAQLGSVGTAPVPEPSGALLIGCVCIVTLLRRRRFTTLR